MEDQRQQRFPWATEDDHPEAVAIALEPATIAPAVALLARAMLAVLRASREARDDR